MVMPRNRRRNANCTAVQAEVSVLFSIIDQLPDFKFERAGKDEIGDLSTEWDRPRSFRHNAVNGRTA